MGQFAVATRFCGSFSIVTVFVQSTTTTFAFDAYRGVDYLVGLTEPYVGFQHCRRLAVWRRLEVTCSTTSTVLLVVACLWSELLVTSVGPSAVRASLVGLSLFLYRTIVGCVISE